VSFFVVKPYEVAKERFARTETDAAPDGEVLLLTKIRDLLAAATGTAGRHTEV
jgi:large conductance mechanosensitive channel